MISDFLVEPVNFSSHGLNCSSFNQASLAAGNEQGMPYLTDRTDQAYRDGRVCSANQKQVKLNKF